jgi:hypothetical protein
MVTRSRQNIRQSVGALFTAILCVGIIGLLQLSQLNKLNRATTESAAEITKALASEKLRLNFLHNLPSFGFANLVADWTFLNFLQYFGDDAARAKTGYTLSPKYFEIILDRDPYFLNAYLLLSASTTLYAGRPDKTIAIMEKGLKHLSPKIPLKSYYIWRWKGADELLFLGDFKAAKQSFEKAAQWASTYSDAEGQNVARISHRTAQFLTKNSASKSAQIDAWSQVLNNAFDDRTRQLAINRIQALGGKVFVTPEGELKILPPQKD